MNLTTLALRFRWLQMPSGLLILLLQRTPMLRVAVQLEGLLTENAPAILRSAFAVVAMGAYNSLAGATVFNVTAAPTAATPTSGAANATFAVSEAAGTAASVAVSVSGAPGNPKSYSVSGTLPAGLTLVGGVGTYVNVVAPYKMTISGTPTTAGTYALTITAWDGSNGTGGNSAKIKVNVTVTGGVANVAPTITTQPSSVTVTAGAAASFTVAASGTPTPTYQWQKGGVNIAGATSATYSIASTVAGDAGSYTAVATNAAGSATSTAATLTVNAATTAPTITTQPSSVTVTAGAAASFTVAASGSPTPTYQWKKGGVNIAGATSTTYSIASTVAGDAGSYTVVATNSAGSATSTAATLTVNAAAVAPTITTQPSSVTVTAGAAASFTVAASGSPTPTYQWQKGGVNIAGATSATYSIASTVAGDAGSYTAVATNSAGSVTSTAATLTVNVPLSAPTITTQPASLTVTAGATATFTVAASGNPSPTYQWKKGGVNIAGATSTTYSIASTVAGDAGSYTVVATNSQGSATSAAATLTVNPAPVAPTITTQPSNLTVTAGAAASFTVAASGTPTPTYQWKKGGVNIIGATSATYSIASTVAGDAGSYTAVATNSAGSVTSAAATLTVNTAPVITTQPTGLAAIVGGSVSFTVAATGTPTPTYQWQKGGVNIAGATSATYTIASAVIGDAGSYTAVATNSVGSVTSAAAALTVSASATAPAITTQPTGLTVTAGASATFTVAATGTPSPTFQWKKGGVNIIGATGPTYSIASTVTGDAGSYTVVATNSAGSVTSAAATLTVNVPTSAPVITTQPASVSVTAGAAASFTVAASGTPTPTYQWQKGGVNIAGATSATYSIASTVAGDAGSYTAVATNSVGSATSTAATLTVNAATTAPAITTQPTNQTVTAGNSATFTVAASGSPTPTYQWYFGGAALSGATSATLSLSNAQAANAGNYYATATNSAGSAISATASLTVQAPAPLTLVASQLVATTHDVAISAGSAVGTMQWQVSSDNGTTWQNLADSSTYSGSASSTLEILNVGAALNGAKYRVLNSGTPSSATTLSVVQGYFASPSAVGTDSAGNLYVSDVGTQTIQKITSAGQVTLVAGSTGQSGSTNGTGSAARFSQPGALAAATDGTLSVADTGNNIVRSVTGTGAVTTLAGTAGTSGTTDSTGNAARFSSPAGIARDGNGVLYVADSLNHTIRKIATGGVVTTFAGQAGTAGSADGTGSAALFNKPTGVAVDSSGYLYVADTGNHTIRKISAVGVVTTIAGQAGAAGSADGTGPAARFNNPGGLALGSSGELYLADTGNSTIRKITPAGVVTTIAGMPGIPGLMDGSGAYAWFDQPEGLTLGTDGNLYIADTGNAMIRKVSLTGSVTTTALTAGSSTSSSSSSDTSSGASGSSGGGGALGASFASLLALAALLRLLSRKS